MSRTAPSRVPTPLRWLGLRLGGLLLAALVLLLVELGVRVWLGSFAGEATRRADQQLVSLARAGPSGKRCHPFLHFVGDGSPGAEHGETDRLYSYLGWEMDVAKPPGLLRVACLGGSTTQSGYPELLQQHLGTHAAPGDRFQALNFGVDSWSTAHSLVNYALRVQDFEPDYAVIHHAWNDAGARGAGAEFRADYSHEFGCYREPSETVQALRRRSALYRQLERTLRGQARPAHLAAERSIRLGAAGDPSELMAFRRNIESILALATARGVVPVLTTQPHAVAPTIHEGDDLARHIDQCNALLREIAQAWGDRLVFVDLDAAMTGTMNEVFTDLAHCDQRGQWAKARAIGDAILAHRAGLQGADGTEP